MRAPFPNEVSLRWESTDLAGTFNTTARPFEGGSAERKVWKSCFGTVRTPSGCPSPTLGLPDFAIWPMLLEPRGAAARSVRLQTVVVKNLAEPDRGYPGYRYRRTS